MRSTTSLLALVSLLTPFVAADLHTAAVCVNSVGSAVVYNADATTKACASYKARNTGSQQWDKCPDCTMKVVGNLNLCSSPAWHIGGDEIQYYCQQHGANAHTS